MKNIIMLLYLHALDNDSIWRRLSYIVPKENRADKAKEEYILEDADIEMYFLDGHIYYNFGVEI